MKKTRVNLLFGFLGSGKTTLARRIIEELGPKRRLALIVNEFGDVGVDGDILTGNNIDLIQLSSGCLCCTLKGSMLAAVVELAEKSPLDHIVIEATGLAEPEEMLATFSEPEFREKFEIGPMITVVDTPKFLKIREILGQFYEAQVEKADEVILNKMDLSTAALTDEVREEILDLNETALIHLSERCDVDLIALLDGPESGSLARYARDEAGHSADEHGEHDHDHTHRHALHAPAESFVFDTPHQMNRGAVEAFFTSVPEGLWRAKGFIRIGHEDYLLQFAMGELEITPVAPRTSHYLVFIGGKLDQAWCKGGIESARDTASVT